MMIVTDWRLFAGFIILDRLQQQPAGIFRVGMVRCQTLFVVMIVLNNSLI